MNIFERLFKVLYAPGDVFKEIAAEPKVIVPLIIITFIAAGFTAYYSFNVDAENIIRKEIEKSPFGDRIPEETLEQIVSSRGEKFAITTPLYVVGFTPIFFLIMALYFYIVCKITKREVSFGRCLSIPVYANAVVIPSAIVGFLIMFLTDFSTVSLADLMPSNLGYFLSLDDIGEPIYSILKAIDFFALWKLVLMTIGLSIILKMDTVKSAITIFVPWVVLIGLGIGMKMIFS